MQNNMGKMNLFVDHLRICLDIYCLLFVNVKPYSFFFLGQT